MKTPETTVNNTEMALLKALAEANVEAGKIRDKSRVEPIKPTVVEPVVEAVVAPKPKPIINFTEIDAQKMAALESLAATNLEVSKVKQTIQELKKDQEVYLKEREGEVLTRINSVVAENQTILAESLANYQLVQDLSKEAAEFSHFLQEAYGEFVKMTETYEEKTKMWEASVLEIEKQHEMVKNSIKVDQVQLKNDREAIAREHVLLKQEKRKIQDERETLQRAITRLKNNQI